MSLAVIHTSFGEYSIDLFFRETKLLWDTRVGRHFSKVGQSGAIWKLLGIETSVVKRFCSEIPILEDKF